MDDEEKIAQGHRARAVLDACGAEIDARVDNLLRTLVKSNLDKKGEAEIHAAIGGIRELIFFRDEQARRLEEGKRILSREYENVG